MNIGEIRERVVAAEERINKIRRRRIKEERKELQKIKKSLKEADAFLLEIFENEKNFSAFIEHGKIKILRKKIDFLISLTEKEGSLS